jgi:hypothetical protein
MAHAMGFRSFGPPGLRSGERLAPRSPSRFKAREQINLERGALHETSHASDRKGCNELPHPNPLPEGEGAAYHLQRHPFVTYSLHLPGRLAGGTQFLCQSRRHKRSSFTNSACPSTKPWLMAPGSSFLGIEDTVLRPARSAMPRAASTAPWRRR